MEMQNPDAVFVCRVGHISKTSYGIANLSCKKLVGDKPCRKKVVVLRTEFAHAIYRRGWLKSIDRRNMIARRAIDEFDIEMRELLDATEA